MILHNIFIQVLFQLSYTVFLLSAIQRLFFGLFIVTVTCKCFATAVNCSQRITINCLNFPKWQKLTSLFTYIYYTGKSIEAHLLIFDFVLFQSHSHRCMKSTTFTNAYSMKEWAVLKSSLIHSVVLYLVPPLQQNSFQEFFLSRYSTINCKCYYCVITTQTWSGRPHKVTEGGLETPTLRWFNKFKTSSGINISSKTALGASSLHGFLWLSSSSNFAVILSLIQGNQTNSSNLGSTPLV